MKIGFSGVGNMASAIISGLLHESQQGSQFESIHAFTPSGPDKNNQLHEALQWHNSNEALAKEVDILILGVKPAVIAAVLQEIRSVPRLPTLVSLAAGITTATMINNLKPLNSSPAIIRTMPNTPSAVQAGMTGLYANEGVQNSDKKYIQSLFESIGETLWLDNEEKFHALTAVSGSGPAYYFQFTHALIEAGIANGLSAEEAGFLAVQTAKGAGLLMSESGKHPQQLQKEVTSPKGTTFAATTSFEESGLFQAVRKAVDAARNRSVEISRQ